MLYKASVFNFKLMDIMGFIKKSFPNKRKVKQQGNSEMYTHVFKKYNCEMNINTQTSKGNKVNYSPIEKSFFDFCDSNKVKLDERIIFDVAVDMIQNTVNIEISNDIETLFKTTNNKVGCDSVLFTHGAYEFDMQIDKTNSVNDIIVNTLNKIIELV